MANDVLSVLEAAYEIDRPIDDWMHNLGGIIYEQFGRGLGLWACEYTIKADGWLKLNHQLHLETSPAAKSWPICNTLELLPPEFNEKTFANSDFTTQSQVVIPEIAPLVEAANALMAESGVNEMLCFSAVEPTGHGVAFFTFWPEKWLVPDPMRELWTRAAVHAVTALRLRARLGTDKRSDVADAVIEPSGTVAHANGEAKLDDALDELRNAVNAVERARTKLRRDDPEAAVDSWKCLVSSRWSLVDEFESDGKRYILAHRNDLSQLSGLSALSPREAQALGFAALGHNNKLIAYELGVTPSTVGVLLHTAARKLGTETRQELVAAYRRLKQEG